MIAECLLIGGLLVGGESYLRCVGMQRPTLVAGLALPTGATLVAAAGLLAVVLRAPLPPAGVVAGVATSLLVFSVVRQHRSTRQWVLLAGLVVGASGVVALVHLSQVAILTWDSLAYGESAALFGRDGAASYHTAFLLERRSLGLAYVHAAAVNTGSSFLPSLSPLMALSGMALLGTVCFDRLARNAARLPAVVVSALLLALVASSHRMAYAAFYLNSHIWVATAVVAVTGIALIATGTRPPIGLGNWPLAVAPSLAALVLLRPEGAMLGALLLVPIVVGSWENLKWPARSMLTFVLGTVTVVWQAVVLWPRYEHTEPAVVIGALFGVALLAAPLTFGLVRRMGQRAVVRVVAGTLVAAAIAASILAPDVVLGSIEATYANVVQGQGLWGSSLVLLWSGVAIAALLFRSTQTILPLFPLLGYLPVALLLAVARGGAYRVGAGDSFNRMLIHLAPLGIMAMAVLLGGSTRWGRTRSQLGVPEGARRGAVT